MTLNNSIKVLLVDDSFFMRKLLREMIQTFSDIVVVGEARNGVEAISQALTLQPDVITMDYHLPDMTGADVTKKILSLELKKLPAIIMLSAFTKDGVGETMECLRAGAFDYIQKPSGELSLDIDKIKNEIELKIRIASKANIQQYPLHQNAVITNKKIHQRSPAQNLVIIGSSTGGPPIVEDIITHLPTNLNASILVVQHMPRFFTNSFAERLDGLSSYHIKQAEHGDILLQNTILIAPGDADLRVVARESEFAVEIDDAIDRKDIHPSINTAMESAAGIFHQELVGVVLSGMGEDGLQGAQRIKSEQGIIIIQNPDSAVVSSMPAAVLNAGAADYVLEPADIPDMIVQLCTKYGSN